MTKVKFYSNLEDMIYDCSDSDSENESEVFPEAAVFKYDLDEISDTSIFLEYIDYLKTWKLFKRGKDKIFNRLLLKTEKSVRELDNMIGLTRLKSNVVKLIFSFCRYQLKKTQKIPVNSPPMMGTILYGRPGVGKTTAATLVANIFLNLGVLSSTNIVYGKRSNMIAGYIGQTALKTEALLNQGKGGVVIIDEVYQLGSHGGSKDGFDKECINTLNQWMSENTDTFVVVCGYKGEVHEKFLSKNEGLPRRFPWRYTLDPYSSDELCEIFTKQAKDEGYVIDSESTLIKTIFKDVNEDETLFYFGGGSTKLLLDRIIDNHSFRTGANVSDITIKDRDIERGYLIYKENLIDQVDSIKQTIAREQNEKKWKEMSTDLRASMYT